MGKRERLDSSDEDDDILNEYCDYDPMKVAEMDGAGSDGKQDK